ncbi:MAG TPA: AzlC family ABC transporter permease [Acidimicrobiia bacterium]|nr:AzlC family ABC transporter permease [Acidimicrobiia bacterium]
MTARAPDARGPASVVPFLPVALAIAVFGTLYGAAARPLLGQWMTLLSSVLIFSGTVQFTMVGLLTAGSGPLAVLWAVVVVNVRNLALGGAVRPRLRGTLLRRLATSWFLIDETVGLALASPASADRTLLRSGLVAYAAWIAGTAIGVAGGAALGLEALAEAVFPVLFIGLAALMVHTVGGGIRALAGAAVTLVLLFLWPGLEGLAPVVGGIVAAIPGGGDG